MDGLTLWAAIVFGCTAVTFTLFNLRARGRLSLPGGPNMGREGDRVCPHLGSAADPFTYLEEPDDGNRCHVYMHHDRIDLTHQQRFCLSSNYQRCPFLMVKPAGAA